MNHVNNFQQKTSKIASDLSSAPLCTSSNSYSAAASLISTNLTHIRKSASANTIKCLEVHRVTRPPSKKGNPMDDKNRKIINYLQQSKLSQPVPLSTIIPKTNNIKKGKIPDNVAPNMKNMKNKTRE